MAACGGNWSHEWWALSRSAPRCKFYVRAGRESAKTILARSLSHLLFGWFQQLDIARRRYYRVRFHFVKPLHGNAVAPVIAACRCSRGQPSISSKVTAVMEACSGSWTAFAYSSPKIPRRLARSRYWGTQFPARWLARILIRAIQMGHNRTTVPISKTLVLWGGL